MYLVLRLTKLWFRISLRISAMGKIWKQLNDRGRSGLLSIRSRKHLKFTKRTFCFVRIRTNKYLEIWNIKYKWCIRILDEVQHLSFFSRLCSCLNLIIGKKRLPVIVCVCRDKVCVYVHEWEREKRERKIVSECDEHNLYLLVFQ